MSFKMAGRMRARVRPRARKSERERGLYWQLTLFLARAEQVCMSVSGGPKVGNSIASLVLFWIVFRRVPGVARWPTTEEGQLEVKGPRYCLYQGRHTQRAPVGRRVFKEAYESTLTRISMPYPESTSMGYAYTSQVRLSLSLTSP